MGLQTDPEATQRPMRDRDPGSTEGNGLLEPCEGQLSRTVLRGGGGGDAAPLPDTSARRGFRLGYFGRGDRSAQHGDLFNTDRVPEGCSSGDIPMAGRTAQPMKVAEAFLDFDVPQVRPSGLIDTPGSRPRSHKPNRYPAGA